MKAIGIKMVDIVPMSVSMALQHGYRVGNAKDAIWNGLGFVLQWAKDGLKRT